jgi:hypothetical protein
MPARRREWLKFSLGKYRTLSGRRSNHLYLLRNETQASLINVNREAEENQYHPEEFLKP